MEAGDLKPRPDPTLLTTEALMREVQALRRDLAAIREFVLSEIGHVKELSTTMFEAVQREFEGIAARTAEQKSDTSKALDAALLSARDAVQLQTEAFAIATAKSESSTTKQIDALGLSVDRLGAQLDDKINDVKDRLNRVEAKKEGADEQVQVVQDRTQDTRSLYALAISVIVAVTLIASVYLANQGG